MKYVLQVWKDNDWNSWIGLTAAFKQKWNENFIMCETRLNKNEGGNDAIITSRTYHAADQGETTRHYL